MTCTRTEHGCEWCPAASTAETCTSVLPTGYGASPLAPSDRMSSNDAGSGSVASLADTGRATAAPAALGARPTTLASQVRVGGTVLRFTVAVNVVGPPSEVAVQLAVAAEESTWISAGAQETSETSPLVSGSMAVKRTVTLETNQPFWPGSPS